MRKVIALALALSLTGCATVRRHPKLTTGVIISAGLTAGLALGLATRGSQCPLIYDGKPYNGTSPCPK